MLQTNKSIVFSILLIHCIVVIEHCGEKLDIQVLGNAPWAVYKLKYPKKIQEKVGKTGEKVRILFWLLFVNN